MAEMPYIAHPAKFVVETMVPAHRDSILLTLIAVIYAGATVAMVLPFPDFRASGALGTAAGGTLISIACVLPFLLLWASRYAGKQGRLLQLAIIIIASSRLASSWAPNWFPPGWQFPALSFLAAIFFGISAIRAKRVSMAESITP
ncbi:hypothetical protein [Gemmobacter nanjingensis]|uniref:hypothetical protein n=1 Tax=Gemmobacter nanjingensis TaxID=488454 RepID=UPI00167398BD|nr:hypothetical protein [Gemmobacter nanjingensis]